MSDCLICYMEKDIFSGISNDAVIDLFKEDEISGWETLKCKSSHFYLL
jgi:hypothetical protein